MDLDLFEKVGETYVRSADALYERLYSGRFLRKLLRYAGLGNVRAENAERGCRKIYTAKKMRADYRSHFDLLPGVTEIFAAV